MRLFKPTAEDEASNEDEDEWLISDLRKIVPYMTISTLDRKQASSSFARDFMRKCVAKFGVEKVKEFMEI